jgi:hypothetical protein
MQFTCRGDASRLEVATQKAGPLRPLFASLGLDMGGPAAPVTDKRTKVEFPGEFCLCSGDRGCPRITGTG